MSRTENISGRHKFHAEGGDCAKGNARRIKSFASPCQMQLKALVESSMGRSA